MNDPHTPEMGGNNSREQTEPAQIASEGQTHRTAAEAALTRSALSPIVNPDPQGNPRTALQPQTKK